MLKLDKDNATRSGVTVRPEDGTQVTEIPAVVNAMAMGVLAAGGLAGQLQSGPVPSEVE